MQFLKARLSLFTTNLIILTIYLGFWVRFEFQPKL